LVLLLEETKL